MHSRVILWVSVGLNAALALAVWRTVWTPAEPSPAPLPIPSEVAGSNTIRTNLVIRRLNFVWSQIESDDYAAFIRNLRGIGCPEPTVRDIILADVNQLYAKRRATEITGPHQQWWRLPDSTLAREAAAKVRALDEERRALLTKLLGPDWESADYPYPPPFEATPLDGPLLGNLAPEVRGAVHQVEHRSDARLNEYLQECERAGRAPDPAELARLRQQTRQDLARLLTPEQYEEYLLRYSESAAALRNALSSVSTTPEEFRALFRSLDPLDQTLHLSAGEDSAEALKKREELEQQRLANLRQVLGEERFEEYRLQQDPLYREARELATTAGADADQILPLAAIMRLSREEEARIRADDSLSAEERAERLQVTREAQRDSLRRLLGQEAWSRFSDRQRALENGAEDGILPRP